MRLLLPALLFLTAFAFAVINHLMGAGFASAALLDQTTTHIGSRVPPVEAGCQQIEVVETDAGKLLNVYACPSNLPG